jgi:hypothetical protein
MHDYWSGLLGLGGSLGIWLAVKVHHGFMSDTQRVRRFVRHVGLLLLGVCNLGCHFALFVLMERVPTRQGALQDWLHRVRRSCPLITNTFLMLYPQISPPSDHDWLSRFALDENIRFLIVAVHDLRVAESGWHMQVGEFPCPHHRRVIPA